LVSAREVFFLIGPAGRILHRDEGSSAAFIPDSRERWEVIWSEREQLVEIAHSHPLGPFAFSSEDESTMSAIASALGRTIVFSVVTSRAMLRREVRPDVPMSSADDRVVEIEPDWADEMRRASGL
jgi:hypothetical protein